MRNRILLTILPFLLAACNMQAGLTSAGTATPFIITATLEPTIIPSATLTPIPATLTPTTVPVQGMTSTQVNVRDQPSTAATSLGIIPPFATVQIIGSDADLNWYEILDPQIPEGKGWVSAQYITVPQNKDKIPVVVGAATATPERGTPPGGTPSASASGTVIQQVNVRKGPGTSFDAVGSLNPNDNVTIIGKDPSGEWYQIAYASAPDGKGWVAASFIQASGTENLPVVGSAGAVIGTATPVAVVLIATAAPLPAFDDRDSAQQPAADVHLSPAATQTLLYSSDLSAPQGDGQDWIRFASDTDRVRIDLTCTGNSDLTVQVTQDGASVAGSDELKCGAIIELPVTEDKAYLVQLSVLNGKSQLSYVHYTLEIKAEL